VARRLQQRDDSVTETVDTVVAAETLPYNGRPVSDQVDGSTCVVTFLLPAPADTQLVLRGCVAGRNGGQVDMSRRVSHDFAPWE